MRHLIKLTLNVGVLAIISLLQPSHSQDISLQKLSYIIENSFNSNDMSRLNGLIETDIGLDLKRSYLAFRKDFPNARWTVNPANELKDKRQSIDLLVTAQKKIGDQIYSLRTNQKLAIKINDGKIVNREVLNEYSILSTAQKPIDITLQIPNVVLTGSWYDIDIIINKPLESSIIAGGLMPFDDKEEMNLLNEDLQLKPMGSGGIFKSVQAPLNPGTQRWAAIIAHPEGILSITKLVRVVSNEEDLNF